MMCFKDRTFCLFYAECANPCDRALTPEIEEQAKKANLLISQYADIPDCFKPKHGCPQ